MNASDFIVQQIRKSMISKGYNDLQANDVANHILTQWKQNKLAKPTQFLEEAHNYARHQFGTPRNI